MNQRALTKQLDVILPLYQTWGIAGVKYGFVNVGSQEATTWLHEAVRKAADHKLMVDNHDESIPTQTKVRISENPFSASDVLTLDLKMNDGAAFRIMPKDE